eukprot:scaffold42336_cov36-Tisochrysis_lutea.AAC.4
MYDYFGPSVERWGRGSTGLLYPDWLAARLSVSAASWGPNLAAFPMVVLLCGALRFARPGLIAYRLSPVVIVF